MRLYIILSIALFFVHPAVAQDNVVDISVSNPQPYIGEQITYTITFTSSLDLSEAQIQLPQFIGFAQEPQTPTLSTIPINNVIQNVIQQDVILYSNRTDENPIDVATIIVPDTPFQTGLETTSETLSINVLPLPDGAPDTFTGGVGQFDINATLDPLTVQAGEPNVLSIIITGSGNFTQLTNPTLRLPETWDVFPSPPTTTNIANNLKTKTFEYRFFADQTGNVTVPAIIFSYFDPLTASYRTISTEAGGITVEGEFTASQSAGAIQPNNRLELKPMTDQPIALIPDNTFWLLWLITPLLAIILFMARLATRSTQPRPANSQNKQSKSLKAVSKQLAQAKTTDPNQGYAIIEQTIFQYLSSKYKQEVSADNFSEVTRNLPDILQQRLNICLEQSQAGRYAPVTQDDADELIRRTYKTLQMIEEERI